MFPQFHSLLLFLSLSHLSQLFLSGPLSSSLLVLVYVFQQLIYSPFLFWGENFLHFIGFGSFLVKGSTCILALHVQQLMWHLSLSPICFYSIAVVRWSADLLPTAHLVSFCVKPHLHKSETRVGSISHQKPCALEAHTSLHQFWFSVIFHHTGHKSKYESCLYFLTKGTNQSPGAHYPLNSSTHSSSFYVYSCQLWSRWCQPQVSYTTKSFSIIFPLGTLGWSWKGPNFVLGLSVIFYVLSPWILLMSWISFGIIVTHLAWMAHKFVSSKSPTRYTSHASCSPIIAEAWILISEFVCHRILYTSLWKGHFLISSSVLFWYLCISLNATVPGWYLYFLFGGSMGGFLEPF